MTEPRDPQGAIEASLEAIRHDHADQDAWTQFYRYFRPKVAGMLFMIGVRSHEDLTELSQEVFYRFLRYSPWKDNWATLPDRPTIMAYLRTVARNVLSTYASKRLRAPEVSMEELSDEATRNPAFWVTCESADLEGLLLRMMESLSPADRTLLALLLAGHSLSAIAHKYGISYTAAGVRIHRLKEKLRGLA